MDDADCDVDDTIVACLDATCRDPGWHCMAMVLGQDMTGSIQIDAWGGCGDAFVCGKLVTRPKAQVHVGSGTRDRFVLELCVVGLRCDKGTNLRVKTFGSTTTHRKSIRDVTHLSLIHSVGAFLRWHFRLHRRDVVGLHVYLCFPDLLPL